MMLDRVELRFRFLNRVHYVLDARVQTVGGISSRLTEDYSKHRILWDLDDCTYEQAIKSLSDVQQLYSLGSIYILSDKNRSYGAVCNTVISFREYLKILIDTDLIDPLFTRYALQRHEGILRLTDKEKRKIHRDIILTMPKVGDRLENDKDYFLVNYETGYIKEGLRSGNFYNDQKKI